MSSWRHAEASGVRQSVVHSAHLERLGQRPEHLRELARVEVEERDDEGARAVAHVGRSRLGAPRHDARDGQLRVARRGDELVRLHLAHHSRHVRQDRQLRLQVRRLRLVDYELAQQRELHRRRVRPSAARTNATCVQVTSNSERM